MNCMQILLAMYVMAAGGQVRVCMLTHLYTQLQLQHASASANFKLQNALQMTCPQRTAGVPLLSRGWQTP